MLKFILCGVFLQLFFVTQAQNIPWFVYVPEIRESLKRSSVLELHVTRMEEESFDPNNIDHVMFENLQSNYFLDSEGFITAKYDGRTSVETIDSNLLKDQELFNHLLNKEYFMDSAQYDFIDENCANIGLNGCTKPMTFAIDSDGLQYYYSDFDNYYSNTSSSYNYAYSYKLNEVNYYTKNAWSGRKVWDYSGDDWVIYKNHSHLVNQHDSGACIKMNFTKLVNTEYSFPREYRDTVAYSSFNREEENSSFESMEEVKTFLEKSKNIPLNQLLQRVNPRIKYETLISQSMKLEGKNKLIWTSDYIKAESTKWKSTTVNLYVGFTMDKDQHYPSSIFPMENKHYKDLEKLTSREHWFKIKTIKHKDGKIKSRSCTVELDNKKIKYFDERYDENGAIISTEVFVDLNFSDLNRLDFLDLNFKNEFGISFNLGIGNYHFTYNEFDLLVGISNEEGECIFLINESEILDSHLLQRNEDPRVYKIYRTHRKHKYSKK